MYLPLFAGLQRHEQRPTLAGGRRSKRDHLRHPPLRVTATHPPWRVADPADEDPEVEELEDATACDSRDGTNRTMYLSYTFDTHAHTNF